MKDDTIICNTCKKEFCEIVGIDDSATVDLDVLGFIGDSVEVETFRAVHLCMNCYLKLIEFLNLQDNSNIIKNYKK